LTARILFLEHNTDGTVGGSHFCLLEICRCLDRSRFQPVVWFYETNPLVEDFRDCGAEVIVQPPPPSVQFERHGGISAPFTGVVQSAVNAFRTLVLQPMAWCRRLRELRIDIVHLNNNCAADPDLIIAAILSRIPCVAHQRGFPMGVGAVNRFLARRLAYIISISNSVTSDLRKKRLHNRHVQLIHDGIDAKRITAHDDGMVVRSALGIPADAPVVGVVGNVKRWKGQLTLVQAIPALLTKHPDLHCLVVGAIADPAYQRELEAVVASAGIGGNVHFAGYQRVPAKYMAAMDVFVHTSVDPEPFGIVNLEAMALRKPVVATAHGGPLDIVLEGVTGHLTPPGDHAVLAVVLSALLANPDKRTAMGEAGRQLLEQSFTAASNAAQIQAIYSSLLSK
jgi:glycosyltransferase involved in cell wall biosynthesis